MLRRLALVLFALASLTLSRPVLAQQDAGWQVTLTPYLWGAGLSGRVGLLPGVPPAQLSLSFRDLLERLEAAPMLYLTARNGDWQLSGDLQYIHLRSDGNTPGPLYGATRLDTRNTLLTLSAGRRLAVGPRGALWGNLGLRHWRVKNSLSLAPGLLPGQVASGRNAWWDPVIGVNGSWQIGDRGGVTGWLWLGGFGAGSELMTDAFVGYTHALSPRSALVAGWRHLTVDRRDGNFLYDVAQSGPLLGLKLGF